MNDQNQLIPNEQGDLPQINEMLKPIFFAIFSTALSVGVSRISDIVSQFYLGNKEKLGTAVEEKDSEALVGAKSEDSLSKTDQIINITPKNEIEIKELNPEKLFDIQLQNLLSKLDSSENNQEIIDKFINDNFKEIKSHPLKHDLVSNIQEFLSSTDDEFITNRQKKSDYIIFLQN